MDYYQRNRFMVGGLSLAAMSFFAAIHYTRHCDHEIHLWVITTKDSMVSMVKLELTIQYDAIYFFGNGT